MTKKLTRSLIIGLICMTIIAASMVIYLKSSNSSSRIKTIDEPQLEASKGTKDSEKIIKSEKVELELPDATPIDALKEDYYQLGSVWLIVDKQYPLSDQQYRPTDLEVVPVKSRSDKSLDERSMRKVVFSDLQDLFADANDAGLDIMVASGFRSYNQQQIYFSNYSRLYGEEAANKFSARPGQSEHQTGLALDISYADRKCYLEDCFADLPAGKWLAENAYKYGFILRYPENKTDITGYQYEPWHFRYVGKPLAKALKESGLTLEEAKPYMDTARQKLFDLGLIKN